MKRELEPYQMIERSIIKKYRKELWTPFIVAVNQLKKAAYARFAGRVLFNARPVLEIFRRRK